MADRFVMCARQVRNGKFTAEPGKSRYLQVPVGSSPQPRHEVDTTLWLKRVRKAAVWGRDARTPSYDRGDLLVFVHGYNNDADSVMKRHDRLKADLGAAGFKGEVLSFDWPSDDRALNYLEDRHDAKRTAMQLVTDGIRLLSEQQTPDCTINIHLLGHSTGAYVIREACDDADDARLANSGWMVSQVVLIAADVSANSLSQGNATTDALYRHCTRLTNYANLYDSVLKLSNAKRMGMAPRAGRVGLPGQVPAKAVNIDCSAYFAELSGNATVKQQDQNESIGAFDHSWHIGNRVFARDLFETLRGDLDHQVLPTRAHGAGGSLRLIRP